LHPWADAHAIAAQGRADIKSKRRKPGKRSTPRAHKLDAQRGTVPYYHRASEINIAAGGSHERQVAARTLTS
jgi:hypothetical protein